jgi:hypothetical protein
MIMHLFIRLFCHFLFNGIIYPDVNGLIHVCASARNVLYIHTPLLDVVDDSPHHVDPIGVKDQQWDYFRIPCLLPWDQNFVDSQMHHVLIHQGFQVTSVKSHCQVSLELGRNNPSIASPLKNQQRVQQLTSPSYCRSKSCTLCIHCQ